MAKLIEPKVLKGFRDFLPEQEIERRELMAELEETYKSFGFVPIDTPVLEYTEVLLGKGGGETDKQVYHFEDHGKRDVAMRFDLTVPFARYMAAHRHELYLPFKRYHINKVWRGENTQKGRYREFVQCDFDIVGVDSASSDFEILLMMRASMQNLGVKKCTVHFSHRGIFNRFLENLGIMDKSVEILRTVDKLAKIGRDEVIRLLTELADGDKAEKIVSFIEMKDSFEATLANMSELAGGAEADTERLEQIWAAIKDMGLEDNFVLNPSITRGLDYYTGLVYETFLDDLPSIGSVCSGGRYNNLAGLYTKEELPGVGASVGLDRLLAALDELGQSSRKKSYTEVLIFQMDDSLMGHYHKMAGIIREAGISCEVYPVNKKLGAQFKFAEAKEIPFGIICGSDEKAAGTVNLKNLASRENHEGISLEKAIEVLKA
ncbi:MAG: histidine--tRNA ligase [Spirochaetales bacterium]|nr:histidine--tRNA ligase [Spirochaetales bacterium]